MRKNQRASLIGLLTACVYSVLSSAGSGTHIADSSPNKMPEERIQGDMNASGYQTAILRTRATNGTQTFLDELQAMGVNVVSEGGGAIVIEAPAAVIEELHHHPSVLGIKEPQQLQMRQAR